VQIKGTGLANRCPEVGEDVAGGSIVLDSSKNYKIAELCLEPKSWQIEEEVTRRRGDTRLGKCPPPPEKNKSLANLLSNRLPRFATGAFVRPRCAASFLI
jgi:hypothetical protein